ncbi:Hypothetical protein, putative [Bodo saltans]|uniref:C3H1-type domain-containing protein n=1 Tax=Bodo saltans TaxID=75058 RepID=A0A0S4IPH7_BODSA|nr:Hypothetical protein, putative [Bodo saltans]|eukprot:CUF03603.1 Hypothetical protein, putative [Bodo saltans]
MFLGFFCYWWRDLKKNLKMDMFFAPMFPAVWVTTGNGAWIPCVSAAAVQNYLSPRHRASSVVPLPLIREGQVHPMTIPHNVVTHEEDFLEVFDPMYRLCYEVPHTCIAHLPPPRMKITRLVICRNYVPGDLLSCTMGSGCKFVHVDADLTALHAHSIHVKYAWRSLDVCVYPRLAAGELLQVSLLTTDFPMMRCRASWCSVTQGSLKRNDPNRTKSLSHCAHYYFNQLCNRGEECCFVHTVHVDATIAGNFFRSSTRLVVPQRERTLSLTKLIPCAASSTFLEDHAGEARLEPIF